MKNRNIGIILGLLPFLAITLVLFIGFPASNTSLSSKAAAQPYSYLQPFPSTSQPAQQPQQRPPNIAASVSNGNDNNPLQNLQNQIDQLKASIANFHTQKLVVTERSGPIITSNDPNVQESKAVCDSDEVVTGGTFVVIESGSAFDIIKSSPSGNGWSVVAAGENTLFKAVAMCAKLT